MSGVTDRNYHSDGRTVIISHNTNANEITFLLIQGSGNSQYAGFICINKIQKVFSNTTAYDNITYTPDVGITLPVGGYYQYGYFQIK